MSNFWNPDMYSKAWNFATRAHTGQTYGGKIEGAQIPYLNHIGSVAMELSLALSKSTEKYDGNLAMQCALLHDVIEDTEYSYHEIEKIFGKHVAKGVDALSKDLRLPSRTEQMNDSLHRIKDEPKEIWMVKLADRITNLYHPPYYWGPEKILSYREESKIIYNALKDANRNLAQRLQQKIKEYTKFAQR